MRQASTQCIALCRFFYPDGLVPEYPILDVSLAKLVNETLAGDQSAFGLLVQRYERLVRSTVMHICNDRHAAEDIAQEAFFTAFESIGKLQQREKFSGWLLSIAKHKAARHVRAMRSREQAVHEAGSIDLLGDDRLSSDSTDLLGLVERLPDHERVIVGLKHFERYW